MTVLVLSVIVGALFIGVPVGFFTFVVGAYYQGLLDEKYGRADDF